MVYDFCLVEVGGTSGDIESLPFQEAIRQISLELGRQKTLFIHLTLLPYVKATQELKTKPTQHSVKELRSIGIQPDILVCRSEYDIPKELKEKIALFTNIQQSAVFAAKDISSIYALPKYFANQKLDSWVVDYFGYKDTENDLSVWDDIVFRIENPSSTVRVAMVGKYVELVDAYKSVNEALFHAGIRRQVRVEISYVDAETIESDGPEVLRSVDAILVPGGFGERGIAGKLVAIQFAREQRLPYLGICLGMQLAVIEYARNKVGLQQAHSTEFDPNCDFPIIAVVEEWQDSKGQPKKFSAQSGGTMRLGGQPFKIEEDSLAHRIYGQSQGKERHRHRYEVNDQLVGQLQQQGLKVSGRSIPDDLIEIIELDRSEHPWFFACQFHPEFKSTPHDGHPVFLSFIDAILGSRSSA